MQTVRILITIPGHDVLEIDLPKVKTIKRKVVYMKKIIAALLVLVAVTFLAWLLVLPIPIETLGESGIYVTTVNTCDNEEDCAVMECPQFQIPLPEPHFYRTGCINKDAFMEILGMGVPVGSYFPVVGKIPEGCNRSDAWVITNVSCFCRIPLDETGGPRMNATLCLGEEPERPRCNFDNLDYCRIKAREVLGLITPTKKV